MKKTEIQKLDDKTLQLRYFLGGLYNISDGAHRPCSYWACSINCSCFDVPDDDRLNAVKNFIQKHNLTNERFLKLAYNYLIGAIMKYHDNYSPLFLELAEVIEPYQFLHTKIKEIPDNNFKEQELETLVSNNSKSAIQSFIKKYNITNEDFIVLAKTVLNYNIYGLQVSNPNDNFYQEIAAIMLDYELTVPREYIEEYRKSYKYKKETAELIIKTKATQKIYMKLMKELMIKDYDLATEMLAEELTELGFNRKRDVIRLTKKKTN